MARWLVALTFAGCGASAIPSPPGGGSGAEDPTGSGADSTAPVTSPTELDVAAQLCVDAINQYRAGLSLAPLARWEDTEPCVDQQAAADEASGEPHSAFGDCSERAQNECTHWPAPPSSMIEECLANMWAEGPGDFATHGHYLNMANADYTEVACGFYVTSDDHVWATQDFH